MIYPLKRRNYLCLSSFFVVCSSSNKIKLAFNVQYKIAIFALLPSLLRGLDEHHWSGLALKGHFPRLGFEDHWPRP